MCSAAADVFLPSCFFFLSSIDASLQQVVVIKLVVVLEHLLADLGAISPGHKVLEISGVGKEVSWGLFGRG